MMFCRLQKYILKKIVYLVAPPAKQIIRFGIIWLQSNCFFYMLLKKRTAKNFIRYAPKHNQLNKLRKLRRMPVIQLAL